MTELIDNCQKVSKLVRSLNQNFGLPRHDTVVIRQITQETNLLGVRFQELLDVSQRPHEDEAAQTEAAFRAELMRTEAAIQRNIRGLSIYLQERLKRLEMLRVGGLGVLPSEVASLCSQSEQQYFRDYQAALASYSTLVGLDLTGFHSPPFDYDVTVRVVEELGSVLDSNRVYLRHGSVHTLPRADADPFLLDGSLVQQKA